MNKTNEAVRCGACKQDACTTFTELSFGVVGQSRLLPAVVGWESGVMGGG
jgi:hypothetical protein